VVSGTALVGDVAGRTAIVIDDLISSGTTLARAAENCRMHGARKVHAAATHGVFNEKTGATLSTPALETIVVTNTVPPLRSAMEVLRDRLVVLDTTPLLAEAIRQLHRGGSITELLEAAPK
jgi:ribose-phosphate pyrophosphokinase